MNYLKKIIPVICYLFSISLYSQGQSMSIDFMLNNKMPELSKKVNVGFYVKGKTDQLKKTCDLYNATYFNKSNEWHYIRIHPNKLKKFLTESVINDYHIPLEKGIPLNDTMRVNNKINDIHNGKSPLSTVYSGNGVIIGFIDTGIDFNHGDFKNTDGTTRIINIWDQTLSGAGNTPQPYGYGLHWNASEINAGLASSHNDIYGHGSTVTGTAAGNGLASGKHMGVAYQADIIAVEVDFGANFLTNVQDATEYIYHIADSLGKPCVINASAGTYFGSHDGNDPSAQYIDSLITSSNGHLFICSAGNSGGSKLHLQHNSLDNDTIFTLFKNNNSLDYAAYGCVPYCYGDNSVHFNGYADVSNFNNVQLAISAYYGDQLSGLSNYFTLQDYLDGNYYTDSYGAYVDSIVNDNNERIGMLFMFAAIEYGSVYNFEIIISPDSTNNYLWGFHSTGSGKSDIWSDETYLNKSKIIHSNDPEFPFSSTPTNYIDPDTLQNMCSSFQCLPSVITVANYINESGYTNSLGNWVNEGGVRGNIASSSSSGPTRNGLIKPDIAASGQTTVSSFPTYLLSYKTSAELADGGLHYKNGGTSMSSPVVAGIAALYLEKCNQANYQNFKSDLLDNAYSDNFTGTLPNYSFGYGKADGFQTLVSSGVNDTISQSACNNYTWNSTTYNSSGYYTYTTNSSKNCDSIVILNLSINKDTNTIDSISSCNNYTWIDGITYTTNNNSASYLLSTINGCDSTVHLNLTINSNSSSIDSQTACDSITWIDGITYNSNNNTATHILTNNSGCDSLVTLNLTISSSSSSIDSQTACDSITWINGITYNSNNNTATHILTNNSGCDSTVTLNLTVITSSSSIDSQTACDSINWIDGITYSSDNNTATHILTNSSGCDSTVTLNLNINNSSYSFDNQSACDSITWINGITYNNNNNTATHILTNNSGCDSIVQLNLTVNSSNISTDIQTACDSLTWIDGLTYNTNNNTATHILTNNFGCDSIVTLNLNINENEVSPLELELILDNYCLETFWTIKDSQDSIWYNEGPYNCNPNGGGGQSNDTIMANINLEPNECYTFELHDHYGDGMSANQYDTSLTNGSWTLTEHNGTILMQGSGNFGNSISTEFFVDSAILSSIPIIKNNYTIKAQPNPFKENTLITINNLKGPFDIEIFDLNGRIIYKANEINNRFYIENENISNGIYWLRVINKPKLIPIHLIITH